MRSPDRKKRVVHWRERVNTLYTLPQVATQPEQKDQAPRFCSKRCRRAMHMGEPKTMAPGVSSPNNPFDQLPLDLIEKILGFDEESFWEFPTMLPVVVPRALGEKLRNLRRVCKLFARVSPGRLLEWDFENAEDGEAFLQFVSNNVGARWSKLRVRVQSCSFDFGVVLQAAIPYLSDTLQSVTVFFSPKLEEGEAGWDVQVLFPLLQSCTNLRHALIRDCHIQVLDLSHIGGEKALSMLNKLSLNNLRIMTASELGKVLRGLPNLQDLFISVGKFETAEPCIINSNTLKTLFWSDEETGDTRIEIKSFSLNQLTLRTRLAVRLFCPSLAQFTYSGGGSLESPVLMLGLEKIVVEVAESGTRLSEILTSSPSLKALRIDYWYNPDGLLLFQDVGKFCQSLVELRLGAHAWKAVCSTEDDVTTICDDVTKSWSCFERLEHIHVELNLFASEDEDEMDPSLLKVKGVLAACKRLKQVDISFWYQNNRKKGILAAVKALSQEHPSCWFVVEKRWPNSIPRRILVTKSNISTIVSSKVVSRSTSGISRRGNSTQGLIEIRR